MNVNEAMTAPVKACYAGTSLDEVARMMWEGDCGAIPVVTDNNKPIGIVTDRDIAMAAMLNHQPLWDIQAATVIQGQRVCCCSQQDSVESCVTRMEQNGVRRIMVTDDSGALCGIVSMGDAVALTSPEKARSRKNLIDTGQLLDMLRKVSSHHRSGGHPLVQM